MAGYYGFVRPAIKCDADGGVLVGLERGGSSDRREGRVVGLLGGMLGMARSEGLLLDVFDPGGLSGKWMYRLLGDESLPLGALPFDMRVLADWSNRPYMAWFERGVKVSARVRIYRGNVVIRRGGGVVGVVSASAGGGDDGLVYSNRSVWRLFEAMYGMTLYSRSVLDLYVPSSRRRGMPDDLAPQMAALLGKFEYRGKGGICDIESRREAELRVMAAEEVGVSLMLMSRGDRIFLGCLPVDAAGVERFRARVDADRCDLARVDADRRDLARVEVRGV